MTGESKLATQETDGVREPHATHNRTAVMIGETPQSSCIMLAKLYCTPYHQK